MVKTVAIIKWFYINKFILRYHNSDPIPIYQWIPERGKRDFSDKIINFVDKNYAIDDESTKFRAIRLIKPTTNLSGRYSCLVSSLYNHDSAYTNVVIYGKSNYKLFSNSKTNGLLK